MSDTPKWNGLIALVGPHECKKLRAQIRKAFDEKNEADIAAEFALYNLIQVVYTTLYGEDWMPEQ